MTGILDELQALIGPALTMRPDPRLIPLRQMIEMDNQRVASGQTQYQADIMKDLIGGRYGRNVDVMQNQRVNDAFNRSNPMEYDPRHEDDIFGY